MHFFDLPLLESLGLVIVLTFHLLQLLLLVLAKLFLPLLVRVLLIHSLPLLDLLLLELLAFGVLLLAQFIRLLLMPLLDLRVHSLDTYGPRGRRAIIQVRPAAIHRVLNRSLHRMNIRMASARELWCRGSSFGCESHIVVRRLICRTQVALFIVAQRPTSVGLDRLPLTVEGNVFRRRSSLDNNLPADYPRRRAEACLRFPSKYASLFGYHSGSPRRDTSGSHFSLIHANDVAANWLGREEGRAGSRRH
jgi:hypothetical protein